MTTLTGIAKALADSIKDARHLKHMDIYLNSNDITDDGAKYLAIAIQHTNLSSLALWLRWNELTDKGTALILESAKLTQLTKGVIHLDDNYIKNDFRLDNHIQIHY